MDIWDWLYDFTGRAKQAGDEARARLLNPFFKAQSLFDTNPDEAHAFLEQGRQMALSLDENWWALFYAHWELQVLLFHKRDYIAALDLAVRSAVEVRKPAYTQLPQRVCLHEDLIYAYVGTDPAGNAEAIESALKYMDDQITPGVSCQFCLQGLRVEYTLAMNRLDEAKRETDRYLAMEDSGAHYTSDALLCACKVCYAQQDWKGLLSAAQEGEKLSRRLRKYSWVAEFLGWQAVANRQHGDEVEASRLYLTATVQAARLGATLAEGYYAALAAYHEVGEQWALAFEIRGRELEGILNNGQLWRECQCRIQRCRLLALMGSPLDGELSAARESARRLKNPVSVLAVLDQIARGS